MRKTVILNLPIVMTAATDAMSGGKAGRQQVCDAFLLAHPETRKL